MNSKQLILNYIKKIKQLALRFGKITPYKLGYNGVMIGHMFFGESMFTRITDGSKVALACWIEYLRQHNCTLIDCQQKTKHLIRLGGAPIEREEFFMRSKELMLCEPLDFKYLQTLQLLKYFK